MLLRSGDPSLQVPTCAHPSPRASEHAPADMRAGEPAPWRASREAGVGRCCTGTTRPEAPILLRPLGQSVLKQVGEKRGLSTPNHPTAVGGQRGRRAREETCTRSPPARRQTQSEAEESQAFPPETGRVGGAAPPSWAETQSTRSRTAPLPSQPDDPFQKGFC